MAELLADFGSMTITNDLGFKGPTIAYLIIRYTAINRHRTLANVKIAGNFQSFSVVNHNFLFLTKIGTTFQKYIFARISTIFDKLLVFYKYLNLNLHKISPRSECILILTLYLPLLYGRIRAYMRNCRCIILECQFNNISLLYIRNSVFQHQEM